jgi:hypothetical protein
MKKEVVNSENTDSMRCRKITLADGRYLIFYEFDESLSSSSVKPDKKSKPRRETVEEKNV